MDISVQPLAILREQLNGLAGSAVALAPNLAAALLVILLTALIAFGVGRTIRAVMLRSRTRPSLVEAMSKLARILVWLFGLLIAATIIFPNLTPSKLLAGLGIGSIAIGLAFKDIFENFLAGFLILMRKPMRIGDDIECEGVSGRVETISMRDTFIRKRSGELVLAPNSFLFKNPLKILTDQPSRRISVVVGVAYGENVDAARDVIRDAIGGIENRDTGKDPQVFAYSFNSSSIDFMARWWCASAPVDEHVSRDEAVAAIKSALDTAGIEIPFPYRTLTFKEPLSLLRGGGAGGQDA